MRKTHRNKSLSRLSLSDTYLRGLEPLEPRLLMSADLDVTGVTLTGQATVLPGDKLKATTTIQNIGDTLATGRVEVKLYASTDPVLDANDTLIATLPSVKLKIKPDATKKVKATFRLDSFFEPGQYFIVTDVDSADQLPEDNETNNTGATALARRVATEFGQVAGRTKAAKLVMADADGTKATFSMKGPGTGVVSRDGDAVNLMLDNTTTASSVTVKVKGGDGRFELTDLTSDGPLKSFSGGKRGLDLIGDAVFTGGLGTLTLDRVTGSDIRIGMATGPGGLFDDGNDLFAPALPLTLFKTVGALSNDSRVFAADFPASVSLAGVAVNPDSDSRFITNDVDLVNPVVAAALANDSGISATDRVTNDPAVSGTVTELGDVQLLTLTVPEISNTAFPITDRLDGSNAFSLDRAALEDILNQTLVDGDYSYSFQATDLDGHVSNVATVATFTLDTVGPVAPTFNLSSGSDTEPLDDGQTESAIVTLVGMAAPGDTLLLVGDGRMATAGPDGVFQFPGVGLVLGANNLEVQAVDAAGNGGSFMRTITRLAASLDVDPVLNWNAVLLEAIRLDATVPPAASRGMAMVHAAIYDAVNAIEGTPSFLVNADAPAGASPAAAVASAAHTVLSYLYPGQQATFDAELAESLDAIPGNTQSETDGVALGQTVGQTVILLRDGDGWDEFVDYVPGADPGDWQPTEPMFEVALAPQWATLTPFAMTSPDQFRSDGPPALNSQEWADAYNEVKALGIATGSTRTTDQTQIARFWADGAGTYTPPGHWNQVASQAALAEGNSLSANARLFAQLNIAMADAAIACWDSKYTFGFWRPVTAIQNGGTDGNNQTAADGAWSSFIITPPFPTYTSGHSTFSGAAATVLTDMFGEAFAFSTTSLGLPDVTRDFTSFDQAAQEAADSRLYGGIHYRFDNEDGLDAGRALGQYVLDVFAVTSDVQPPTIIVQTPVDGAADDVNPTVTGFVLDNLSGVATFTAQLDNGAPFAVAPGAGGAFNIPVNLALDGSADGLHVLRLTATDNDGNAADPVDVSFILDTVDPAITVDAPLVNAVLAPGAMLTGTADPTGSMLTSLLYGFDAPATMPLTFNSTTGAFDQLLDLSLLTVGDHVLNVTATDLAGNTTTESIDVSLAGLVPLTVTAHTPTTDAGGIGTTFRPQVFFSRRIDTASINDSNLFATDSSGAVLDAAVVPASDGSFAWLFFTDDQGNVDPMPGGSTITVHIGGTILADGDGQALDADGDGNPGGDLQFSFTTVSLVPLPGTSLSGKVVDPGPDFKPMTFDDVRAGADGILHSPDDVFLLPIAGVKVFIVGLEDQFVLTDAQGNFSFDAVPGGNIKLALDGNTAPSDPSKPGIYFPEMVMDLNMRVGEANTIMGSSASLSPEEQIANADRQEVYLPRLRTAILQNVSDSETTMIGVDPESAPSLSDEQRSFLTLEISPQSLIGPDGQPLSGGQVGLSTVPPELVREMLPPGLLQHTFDITIQAPGAATFSEPQPITFPNLFGAAPGTKLNFLSFDHTTGRLVIEGTATVSADGLSATTDPGMGITKPGWHGLTPPGTESDPPCDPAEPHIIDVPPVMQTQGIMDYFFKTDEGKIELSFANFAQKIDPGDPDPCSPINVLASPLLIEVMLDNGSANRFLTGMSSRTFSLQPGQVGNINATVDDLIPDRWLYDTDELYGVKIKIHAHWVDSDGVDHNLDGSLPATEIYAYRFLDVADNRHTDGKIDFPRTAAAGAFTQKNPLPYKGEAAAKPTISVSGGTDFTFSSEEVQFNPATVAQLMSSLIITTPGGMQAGQIDLAGTGIDVQNAFFSAAELNTRIKAIVDANPPIANNGRLVSMFPDSDGDGSRTTGADLAGFNAAVTSLHSDMTVQFYVQMLGVGAGTLDTVTLVNGTPGTGDKVNLNNTFSLPAGSQIYTGGAAAAWADFGIDYFLNTIVPNENNNSVAENKYSFVGLFNRSVSDVTGSPFIPGGQGMILNVDQMVAGVAGAAGAGAAAFRSTLVNQFASTMGHEFGHLLGAIHQRTNAAPYSSNFLMGLGTLLTTIPAIGPDFIAVFKAALGIPVTKAEFNTAYAYYKLQANNDYTIAGQAYAFNNGGNPVPGPGRLTHDHDAPGDPGTDLHTHEPYLSVVDGPADDHLPPNVVTSLDFGTVLSDGAGGTLGSQTIYLFNTGEETLHLTSVLIGGGEGFSLSGFSGPVDLPAFDEDNPAASRLALTVTFDPTDPGADSATLLLVSDSADGQTKEVELSGLGVSPFGHLALSVPNNNLGGVKLGQTGSVLDFATLSNDGSQPLTITSIAGTTALYSVAGLPGNFPAVPIVLQPGESVSFDASFTPDMLGLRPGQIEIESSDPDQPSFELFATGTGLPTIGSSLDYGNDAVAIQTLSVLRTTTDANGGWSFFLPAETPYDFTLFDPISGLVGSSGGVTGPSGQRTQLPTPIFGASTQNDTDSDGLPDDVEFALGTGLGNPDSDQDGVNDGIEVLDGDNTTDPLDGRGLPTGVISGVELMGSAKGLVVEGSEFDAEDRTVYLATGSHGLAIVDPANLLEPIVLGQLDLPGDATDVAVDTALQIAAIASNVGGIHLVDVSDPAAPTLIRTINVVSGQVEVASGVLYAAVGSQVRSYDLITGSEDDLVNVGGTITGLAREGSFLYTMSTGLDLRVVDIGQGAMAARGTLDLSPTLSAASGLLFVGGGVAYIGAETLGSGFTLGGFATVDVSNPDSPALLSGVDLNSLAGRVLAANGSGLGVTIGSPGTNPEPKLIDLLSLTDPANTGLQVTRFDLTADPLFVVIGGGIAFVADGTAGLAIVNYLSFDAEGVAPTVTITSSAVDLDAGTPGVQVLEGSLIPIAPFVTDDFQARNLELLVNGETVANDLSFPFEFFAVAPNIEPGSSTFTVQVRASDTGGNEGLSNVLTFNLVEDTFGPSVVSSKPAEGQKTRTLGFISIRFDEPLDPDLLDVSGVTLTHLGDDHVLGGGDDTVTSISSVETRGFDGRSLAIFPADFVPGDYQLVLSPTIVQDRAGNAMVNPFTLNFIKRNLVTPLVLEQTYTADVEPDGDVDRFEFLAANGDRLFYDALSSYAGDLQVELVAPSGDRDYFYYSGAYYDSYNPVTLQETGVYTLEFTSPSDSGGSAMFRLLGADSAATLPVDPVDPSAASLDPLHAQLFRYDGTAGERLYFDAIAGDFSTYWYLFGPNNQQISGSYSAYDFEATLPATGEYILEIYNNSANTGSNLTFRITTPTTTTTPLTLGNDVSGNFSEPGDIDEYTFTGMVGQRLYFDSLDNDVDYTSVQLRSPSGTIFFNNYTYYDAGPITLTESGAYRLILDGYQDFAGDYDFRLLDVSAAPVTALALDTPVGLAPIPATALDITGSYVNSSLRSYAPQDDWRITQTISGTRDDAQIHFPTNDWGSRAAVGVTGGTDNDWENYSVQWDGTITIANDGTRLFTWSDDGSRLWIDLDQSGTFDASGDEFLNNGWGTGHGATYSQPSVEIAAGTYTFRVQYEEEFVGNVMSLLWTNGDVEHSQVNLEADLFRFDGVAGQHLFFDGLTVNDFYGAYLTLYGPNNQQVASNGIGGDVEYTLLTDGQYVVAVSGQSPATKFYGFQAITPDTTTTAMTLGDDVNGTLTELGEKDIHTFTGTAGQRLFYDALYSDNNYVTAQLLGPNGKSYFSSYAYSDQGPVTLTESGEYRLILDDTYADEGGTDYSFRLIDFAAAPVTNLVFDTPITTSAPRPGLETDFFRFTGTAGQHLYVDTLSSSDANGAYLILYKPDNGYITYTGINSDLEATLATDGEFFLAVQGLKAAPFEYSLTVVTPATTTAPLALGATTMGTIDEPGAVDLFTFSGTAGQRLFYDSLDNDFDGVTAQFVAPSGAVFFTHNSSYDSGFMTLTETGVHTLRLDGDNDDAADYTFRLLDLNASPVQEVQLNSTTVNDSHATATEDDLFRFNGTAGQMLTFDSLTIPSSLQWYLYLPGNAYAGVGHGSGGDFTATLPYTGQYLLFVGDNSSGGAVDYSFRVIDNTPAPVTPAGFGEVHTGTVGGGDDEFPITASAGTRVFLDSQDRDFDGATAHLFDGTGSVFNGIAAWDDSSVFVIPRTGNYTLRFEGSGDYSARLFNLDDAAPLTLGDPTGTLDPGTKTDVYQFTGEVGLRLFYDAIDNDFDSVSATLRAPDGSFPFSNNASSDQGPVTLDENGTYYLFLTGTDPNAPTDYTFVLDDFNTATGTVIGGQIDGTLPTGRESDLFRFNGTAGQRLYFNSLDANPVYGAYFILYGPSNSYLTYTGTGYDLEQTLPFTGEYYLLIQGITTVAATYSYEIVEAPTNIAPLTLGSRVQGMLDVPGEVDEYTFNGTAGQRVYLDSTHTYNADSISAQLLGPNGASYFNNDSDYDYGPVTLSETGVYRLRIDGYQDVVGAYDFRLLNVGAATSAAFDTEYNGTLDPGIETDLFTFNGTAGQRVYFQALAPLAGGGGTVYFYRPDNTYFDATTIGYDREITLTQDGQYVISFQGSAANPVNYGFKLYDSETTDDVPLTLGANTMGSISEPGEIDAYTFTGTPGQRLYFDGLDPDFAYSVLAQLKSPSGATFFNNYTYYDAGPITLTEPGTYRLTLDGSSGFTGNYSFRVLDVSAAPVLAPDVETAGALDPGREAAVFRIAGTAGQRLYFDNLSATAGTNGTWYLYNPVNGYIAGNNLGFDFEATLPYDGEYALVFAGYTSDPVNNYTFIVRTPDTITSPLTLNADTTGTLLEPGDQHIFTFTGAAGQRLFYDGIGGDFVSITAQLISPSGTSVISVNADSDTFYPITLTETGPYRLVIDGSQATTGGYAFRLLDLSAPPTEDIALDTEYTRNLGAYSVQTFRIQAAAGQSLVFDSIAAGQAFGGTWYLFGPNNQFIDGTSIGFDFTTDPLTRTGDFILVAYSTEDTPFDFTFQVRLV